MKMIHFLCTLCFCLGTLSFQAWSQPEVTGGPLNVPTNGIIDGVYMKEIIPTKKLIEYEHVREADYVWGKRVYQRIDLRERINHPIYFPFDEIRGENEWVRNASRWSLWTIIRNSIVYGDLTVFDNENPNALGVYDGDQFKYPITSGMMGGNYQSDSLMKKDINRLLGTLAPPKTDAQGNFLALTSVLDPELDSLDLAGNPVYPEREMIWITSQDIVAYYLKEDWFFDKERSVLDCRILGIAPVVYFDSKGKQVITDSETGAISDAIQSERALFWLYFPHLRYTLNNYFVYNDANDAQWMSFDDLFWKRRFNSTMYKESNTYDRKIESYRTGAEALMEADRIKEEIRTIEHDVWSF